MSFCSQFDFDPKEGRVPAIPFSPLPNIASRARLLLHRRSRDAIAAAAEMIEFVLNSYFDDAERHFIDEQLQNNGWACKYLSKEARTPAGLRELIARGLPDAAGDDEYFNFPTSENTTEVEALKVCIHAYDFEHEDFRNPQDHELFAILALSYLGDCLHWLDCSPAQPGGRDEVTNPAKVLRPTFRGAQLNLSLAARMALMAMDAVCYAEHLSLMPRAEEERQGLMRDARQAKRREDEYAKILEQRTAAAKRGAIERHREHAEIREQVLRHYEENKVSYKSVEHAAREIAGILVPVTHRTVVDWIHSYRRLQTASRP